MNSQQIDEWLRDKHAAARAADDAEKRWRMWDWFIYLPFLVIFLCYGFIFYLMMEPCWSGCETTQIKAMFGGRIPLYTTITVCKR